MKTCTIDGCEDKHLAQGYCNKHYRRMRRHGRSDYEPKGSMYKHGMYGTTEYTIWSTMKQRCNNPKCGNYRRYGGRGIKVCERWAKFENFLADMGMRPSKDHSIDRIDNDGNYTPKNCKWSTRKEQNRNRRGNTAIEFRGETLTLAGWADRCGIRRKTLDDRINGLGWSVEKALTTPIR